MATIVEMRLNSSSDKIIVKIATDLIGEILFWSEENFLDESLAIDITTLAPSLPSDNNEYEFEIEPSDVNLEDFNGIFFFKVFVRNQDTDPSGEITKYGIVANLNCYYDCLLDKTLEIKTDGCKQVINECKECEGDTFYISLLLINLRYAITHFLFEEIFLILHAIDKYCNYCPTCPKANYSVSVPGYNYGTIEDQITLL